MLGSVFEGFEVLFGFQVGSCLPIFGISSHAFQFESLEGRKEGRK